MACIGENPKVVKPIDLQHLLEIVKRQEIKSRIRTLQVTMGMLAREYNVTFNVQLLGITREYTYLET